MNILSVILILLAFNNLVARRPLGALEADTAYRSGDFEKASRLYEDLVVNNPRDMQSLYNAGKSALKAKNYSYAKVSFAHVETSSFSSSELKKQALFNKGDVELLQGNYDVARIAYESVLKTDPAHEGAKKRIELINKLREQQKKNEQKSQQKNDKKKREESTSDKQDSQRKNQKNDGQKDNKKASDTSKNQGNDTDKQGQEDSQKSDNKSEREKPAENARESKGSQAAQKSSNNPQMTKPREQETSQEETQKGENWKTDQKGHKKPQYQDTMTNKKGQKAGLIPATPDQKLTDEEKELLAKVEKHDRNVYKTYFAQTGSQKQESGQKNW